MESQSTQAVGARFAPPPPPPAPAVKFGDGPSDTIPLVWAERILRMARERKPRDFGKWLAEAALANGNGPGQ